MQVSTQTSPSQTSIERSELLEKIQVQRLNLLQLEDLYFKLEPNDRFEKGIQVKEWLARYLDIPVQHMDSTSHKKEMIYPRHLFWWVLRVHFGFKFKEVVAVATVNDHTTILHAVNKISNFYEIEKPYRDRVDLILKMMMDDGILLNLHGLLPSLKLRLQASTEN